MALISISSFLLGLTSFFNKKKEITLICLFLLAYDFINLIQPFFYIGSISIQNSDLALLLIFCILPFRSKVNYKEVKGIQIILVTFLIFLLISVLYDVSVMGTTLSQSFRTLRNFGFLFFFFIINKFNFKDYNKFFDFILNITIIHSIIYISQYIFEFSFFVDNLKSDMGEVRYSNSPPFLYISLVLLLFKKKLNYSKILIILIAVLCTLSRVALIVAIISIVCALIFKYKFNAVKVGFSMTIIYLVLSSIISYSNSLNNRIEDANEQISSINYLDFDNLNSFYHQGSFIFRVGLTYERLLYVLEDPKKIFLGVGFVPDFDIKRKIFVIGTESEVLPTGFEQYNSGDILYPNIITRFGIFGSLLFMAIIFKILLFSLKNTRFMSGKILATYVIALLFSTFNNQSFYEAHQFLLVFMLIQLIFNEKKKLIS